MDLPVAELCHRTADRLRLKVTSRRSDAAWFDEVSSQLARLGGFERVAANPLTGSILLVGRGIDDRAIVDFARSKGLFRVVEEAQAESLAHTVANPLQGLNASIAQMTRGRANLASVAFLMLVGFGFFDILKGDFKIPPWYTAFWYAFGIFAMTLAARTQPIQ